MEFELHVALCINIINLQCFSFINTGASADLSRNKVKKTYHNCITYSFLFEGCFCFPLSPSFPKHIKFGQNFVTKKPRQKTET